MPVFSELLQSWFGQRTPRLVDFAPPPVQYSKQLGNAVTGATLACVRAISDAFANASVKLEGNDASPFMVKGRRVPNAIGLAIVSQSLDVFGNSILNPVSGGFEIMNGLQLKAEMKGDNLEYFYHGQEKIDPANVIHLFNPDVSFATTVGTSTPANDPFAYVLARILKFQDKYFYNDTIPFGTVEMPKGITPAQVELAKAIWAQSRKSDGSREDIAFIPDGGKFVDHGAKNLSYTADMHDYVLKVRQSYRVPNIVFGDVEKVNFANGLTSIMVFYATLIAPRQKMLEEALTLYTKKKYEILSTFDLREFAKILKGTLDTTAAPVSGG